jgi:hypothetical protein
MKSLDLGEKMPAKPRLLASLWILFRRFQEMTGDASQEQKGPFFLRFERFLCLK